MNTYQFTILNSKIINYKIINKKNYKCKIHKCKIHKCKNKPTRFINYIFYCQKHFNLIYRYRLKYITRHSLKNN